MGENCAGSNRPGQRRAESGPDTAADTVQDKRMTVKGHDKAHALIC